MATFAELFGPNLGYPYFDMAREHPFQPSRDDFSAVNANWTADASLLVYLREESQVADRLAAGGLEGVCVGFQRPGAQCFVAHGDGWSMVSFRGTEVAEWEDVVADARVKLERHPPHHGRVHRGFHDALESIWPEVEAELARARARAGWRGVWFTGHSLGAAMATLAGDRHPDTRAVYNYGSPRVGDEAFVEGVRVPVYRFVNNNDAIPTLPPGRPLSPYRHVGDLKYMDESGALIQDPAVWIRIEAGLRGHLQALQDTVGDLRRGDLKEIEWDRLRDHSPTAYASNLRKALE